jgi:YesN/AraC family two-component response regulator
MVEKDTRGIDLVITDMVMPGMNGCELIERVSKIRPDIKSIFMSGYRSDFAAHHGGAKDLANFLQKPFSKRDLAAKVSESLELKRGIKGASQHLE